MQTERPTTTLAGQTISGELNSSGFVDTITGTNTHFLTDILPGDYLQVEGQWIAVTATSDTTLQVNTDDIFSAFSGVTPTLVNWTKVPDASEFGTAFNYQRGTPDANSLVFPQQFEQLQQVLTYLQSPPAFYGDTDGGTVNGLFTTASSAAFLTVATKVIDDYDAIFGPSTDTLETQILSGDLDPGAPYQWNYIAELRSMTDAIGSVVLVRDSSSAGLNGWMITGTYDNSLPQDQQSFNVVTYSDLWGTNYWTTTDDVGNTLGSGSPIDPAYLSQVDSYISQIPAGALWLSDAVSTPVTITGDVPNATQRDVTGPDEPVYRSQLDPAGWSDGNLDNASLGNAARGGFEPAATGQDLTGVSVDGETGAIDSADWEGELATITLPDATNPYGGSAFATQGGTGVPQSIATGPNTPTVDAGGWSWGSVEPVISISSDDMYNLLTSSTLDAPAVGINQGGWITDNGLIRGLYYTTTCSLLGSSGGDVYAFGATLQEQIFGAPSLYGRVNAANFSYTPSSPDNSIAAPPSDPLPITSQMEYENVVPDTDLDDIVQVDHDQTSFGPDTGSISFEAQRGLPQVYIPLNTDGMDEDDAQLPVHAYLVQGGFGTSANDVGDLGTNAWTFSDVNENGQPYAYSLDTRVDVNFIVNDPNNHVKRIEVVRPRGNTVVFDFAWDDATQAFSATGLPTGIDSSRLYVLRAAQPGDDTSLSYEMLFPSGIIQKFDAKTGGLISVSDANSGFSEPVAVASLYTGDAGTGLSYDAAQDDSGDPAIPDSSRYTMQFNWADGTIAGVDYTTNPASLNTTAGAATIETAIGYESNGTRITSLEITSVGARPAVSYTADDPGAIIGNGFEIDREATAGSASPVTIRTTLSGVSGSTADTYTINAAGLITGDTLALTEPDGTTSEAATAYTYPDSPDPGSGGPITTDRFANGSPIWGKVTEVDYPDGSWEQFAYDPATGWVTDDVTPFKDSAAQTQATDSADDGQDVSYGYDATQSGSGLAADPAMLVAPPRVTTTMVEGITTGITYNDYQGIGGLTVETRQASSNTGSTWANAVMDTTTTLDGFDSYAIQQGAASITHSAGDLDDSDIESWGNTVLGSSADSYNAFGGVVSSSSAGLGQTPVATTGTPTVDALGRTLSAAVTGGLTSSASGYGWFGPATATGADHEPITYTYTALGQILTAASLNVTTTYGYDAAGNNISTSSVGTANGGSPITTTTSAAYDALGRMTSSTDAMGVKTTYVYNDSAHTVTITDNALDTADPAQTEVDSYYSDGALKSIGGTATTPSSYDEGVSSNGDTWSASSIDGGTTWSKSFTNMLGQNYMQTEPTADGSFATSTTLFDGNGRPYQTTDFDGSVTQTVYDPATGLPGRVSQITATGSYVNGTENGPSRSTLDKFFNNTTADSDGNVYSGEIVTSLSSSGNVATVYEEADGGLISREIDNATLDSNNLITGGLVTTTATTIGSGAGVATVLTTLPDNTQVKDNYTGDLLQSEQQLGSNGSVVTSQSFGYDALNRNTSSTDPVFGTTSETLRLDGSVSGETMPGHAAATVTAADATTEIPTASTRSDGGTDTQAVNTRGQVTSQSGAGLIASTFGYDSATGQLNSLSIYPSGTVGSGTAETTQWGYDPASGALTSETMADSVSGSDKITYGYSGVQEKTITGEGDTTTLGYNTAGEQSSSTSNDGTTTVAGTVQSQDDQGNPTAIVGTTTNDVGGAVTSEATDSFTYANGNLTSENEQAVGVTVHYDYYATDSGTDDGASPGAIEDMKLMQGTTVLSTTTYEYDATTGRLQYITVNGTTFEVNYLSNSNVIQSIGTSAVGTTWTYNTYGGSDGDLGGISTSITGGATDYSAAYTYNANDQRNTETVSQLNADGSTSSHNWIYNYDDQDELTTVVDNNTDATLDSYTYDGVGNQTGTSMGTAYSLNEYSNDTYNARGDETSDGTEAFTWNAADKLTAVTANDHSFKDTFQYDGEGRLIEKDLYSWNTTSSTWSLSGVRKLVYDGTNLVAELNGDNSIIDSYAWGPNGLMSVTDFTGESPTTYLTALDGNGNVVQLDNATTGAVAANFTYSPYGKLLTATGPAAGVGNIRSDGGGYYVVGANIVLDKNRFVSTTEGHWLTRDPAGIAGGSNEVVYCNDDPINETDSSGLAPQPNQSLVKSFASFQQYGFCAACHGSIDGGRANIAAFGSDNIGQDQLTEIWIANGDHPIADAYVKGLNEGVLQGGFRALDNISLHQIKPVHNVSDHLWQGMEGTTVGRVSDAASATAGTCFAAAAAIELAPAAAGAPGQAWRILYTYTNPAVRTAGALGVSGFVLGSSLTPQGREILAQTSPDPVGLLSGELNSFTSSYGELGESLPFISLRNWEWNYGQVQNGSVTLGMNRPFRYVGEASTVKVPSAYSVAFLNTNFSPTEFGLSQGRHFPR